MVICSINTLDITYEIGDDKNYDNKEQLPEVTNVDFLDKYFFDDLSNSDSKNYANIM